MKRLIRGAALVASMSVPVAAQRTKEPPFFKREDGVMPFVGVHLGLPEGISATLAGAVGLGRLAPGFIVATIEPGYGAGRRSVGWLLRYAADPLEPLPEFGFGTSLRISELRMYRNGALYPPGLHYFGPELQVSFGLLGARFGVYAGSGSHRSPVAVSVGLGGGV